MVSIFVQVTGADLSPNPFFIGFQQNNIYAPATRN